MGRKIKDKSQKEIHAQAVALRKLSDDKLVERVMKTIVSSPEPQGANVPCVSEFIKDLETAHIAGIGAVTLKKIHNFAAENGYIK